jgi:hypothetical protein
MTLARLVFPIPLQRKGNLSCKLLVRPYSYLLATTDEGMLVFANSESEGFDKYIAAF